MWPEVMGGGCTTSSGVGGKSCWPAVCSVPANLGEWEAISAVEMIASGPLWDWDALAGADPLPAELK